MAPTCTCVAAAEGRRAREEPQEKNRKTKEGGTLRILREHHAWARTMAAICLALAPWLAVDAARAQSPLSEQDMMQVDDEPGRVSAEEAVISDGPYARQVVLFRSSEAPGTLVIHTSERFAYLIQGNNRALRYGIGVG